MDLRKNNGYVGMDISVSVIILLILIPIITGMIYNINKTNGAIERKTQAMNVAVNIMEIAKGVYKNNFTVGASENSDVVMINGISNELKNMYTLNNATLDGNKFSASYTQDSIQYEIIINVNDYSNIDSNAKDNKVKTIKSEISYKSGGQKKTVELSTVIKK